MKVQNLIANAPPDKEEERFIDLTVRIPVYGHESTVWKTALTFMRNARLTVRKDLKFFAAGEELEDDMSDDDSETWHALDWTDPAVKNNVEDTSVPPGTNPDAPPTLAAAHQQQQFPWMGGGLEIQYDYAKER